MIHDGKSALTKGRDSSQRCLWSCGMVRMLIHMQGKGGQLNSKSPNQKAVKMVATVRVVTAVICVKTDTTRQTIRDRQ